ncbi:Asp_protease domain-containing protein [Cephalotus follicularis]|uniref:Asp_protease domain-containing protein n=1 Tax=Cephalotus follicularis TaxID=3775 RepID=A0A1Q3CGA8_CEPFO|nr:Asp_protease domain-containing protein [Cephalotus follicularis]
MGVGALTFLNALNLQLEENKKSHKCGLMYVDVEINAKTSQANTGATHNFVDVKKARRTYMCFTKDTRWLKVVNSKSLATEGLAKDVLLKLGQWGGHVNFTVATMNDFDMVLGLEFLTQAKVIPIPAASWLLIMGDSLLKNRATARALPLAVPSPLTQRRAHSEGKIPWPNPFSPSAWRGYGEGTAMVLSPRRILPSPRREYS